MEAEFWLQRWRDGGTPWNEGAPNAALRRHVYRLALEPGSRVFVPLCGKAEDMWWLRQTGHEVLGIDLSPIAAREFLGKHGLPYTEIPGPRHTAFDSRGIRILAGDFFSLEAEDLAGVRAVYDRAALVTLPAPTRQRYARRLASLLGEVPILLVSMVYPEHEIEGPPFPVPESEIRALYGGRRIRHLGEEDIIERSSLRKRGVTQLREHAWLIE